MHAIWEHWHIQEGATSIHGCPHPGILINGYQMLAYTLCLIKITTHQLQVWPLSCLVSMRTSIAYSIYTGCELKLFFQEKYCCTVAKNINSSQLTGTFNKGKEGKDNECWSLLHQTTVSTYFGVGDCLDYSDTEERKKREPC